MTNEQRKQDILEHLASTHPITVNEAEEIYGTIIDRRIQDGESQDKIVLYVGAMITALG